jgi:hypothetical protein
MVSGPRMLVGRATAGSLLLIAAGWSQAVLAAAATLPSQAADYMPCIPARAMKTFAQFFG